MANLESCLNKAGKRISDADKKAIRSGFEYHLKDGKSASEAAIASINDLISEASDQRDYIAGKITDQGGKVEDHPLTTKPVDVNETEVGEAQQQPASRKYKTRGAAQGQISRYANEDLYEVRPFEDGYALFERDNFEERKREAEEAMRRPGREKNPGMQSYSLDDERGGDLTKEQVQKAFPTGNIVETDDGFGVILPNGAVVDVASVDDITVNTEEAQKAYGEEYQGETTAAGSFTKIGSSGIIKLAKRDQSTLDHESFHAAFQMALTRKEQDALLKKYGSEEAAAKAYETWDGGANTLFEKIKAFFEKIADALGIKTADQTMRNIKSGSAWDNLPEGFIGDEKSESIAYSLNTWTEDAKNELREWNRVNQIFEPKQMEDYIAALDGAAKIIAANPALQFTANEMYTPFKDNSDPHYVKSLDFSTLCKKRLVLQATIEAIQLDLGRGLTPDEYQAIRERLKRDGHVVSCGVCYVDTRRMNMGKATENFLTKTPDQMARITGAIDYDQALEEIGNAPKSWFTNPKRLSDKKLKEEFKEKYLHAYKVFDTYLTGKKKKLTRKLLTDAYNDMLSRDTAAKLKEKAKKTEAKEIFGLIKAVPKDMFLTQEGFDRMKAEHNEAYVALKGYLNAQSMKTPESRTEYDRQIIKHFTTGEKDKVGKVGANNQKAIDRINAKSGQRWQSWSDFELIHALDSMQAIIDMALVGLHGHSYTKVPEMVKVLGNTGLMINLSLIPQKSGLNTDGSLRFDSVEGMPFETAQELRKQYQNTAGTIAIGISDEHIRAMMAHPEIDYIIPYHASGLARERMEAMEEGMSEWTDYAQISGMKGKSTDSQNEVVLDKNKLLRAGGKVSSTKGIVYEPLEIENWWDPNKTGDENAAEYLRIVNEAGLRPKFPMFLNEDYTEAEPGYWKMLIDRRMYDDAGNGIVQGPVRPEFNMEEVNKLLQNYSAEDYNAPKDIVDEMSKKIKDGDLSTEITVSVDDLLKKGVERPAASRRTAPPVTGSTVAQVEEWLAKPLGRMAKWAKTKVQVVQSIDDLNRETGRNNPPDVRGMYHKGKVWLVADSIEQSDAKIVLAHEVVGHMGLETFLGPDKFNQLAKQIQRLKGTNDSIKEVLAEIKKAYVDENGEYNLSARQESREILAHLAEKNPNHSIVRRVKAWARLLLAKHGFGSFPDAYLESLIVAAARHTETNYSGFKMVNGELQPAYMVAYHGTPHDVDRFSTDKIGTGEGAQAYGYGLYFAGKKEVAEWYRDKLSKPKPTYKGKPLSEIENWRVREALGKVHFNTVFSGGDLRRYLDNELFPEYYQKLQREQSGLDEVLEDRAKGDFEFADDEVLADYEQSVAELTEVVEILRNLEHGDVRHTYNGNLYKVELAPEEDEYLLWDKPLSEQSEKVRNALEPIFQELEGYDYLGSNRRIKTGAATGKEIYRAYTRRWDSDKVASLTLHDLGIRGIKYLDGNTRNDGGRWVTPDTVAGVAVQNTLYEAREDYTNKGTIFSADQLLEVMRFQRRPKRIIDEVVAALDSGEIRFEEGDFNYVIFNDEDVEITGQNDTAYSRRPVEPDVEASSSSLRDRNRQIREQNKPVVDKARKFLRRHLSPGGLLPTKVFNAKISRDSEMGATEIDIGQLVGELERAVKAEYGVPFGKLNDAHQQRLNKALGEDFENLDETDLPDRVKRTLVAMRRYIDPMSQQYAQVLWEDAVRAMEQEKPELAEAKLALFETITGNIGSYLHRSYRAFDDPKWPTKVPDEVLNNARDYLESRGAPNADHTLNTILKEGTAFDSMEAFIKESKLGAKDLSVLKRRKDIAPEIRALLGEYVDPRVNFAKSATKMSRLLFNDRFLKQIKEIGVGTFLFEESEAPADHYKQIAADQSEPMAPLNGYYTTPEIEQAFRDALGKERLPDWYRAIVQANGLVKYGKTVLSPTTAARNWMSAYFFTLANGHFNIGHGLKSLKSMKAYFKQQGGAVEYMKNLKKLGVIYDTPYASEMMRLLEDTNFDDKYIQNNASVKKVFDTFTRFYSFGDDFWKIIGFENEIDILMKRKNLTREEAEPLAAKRIRDTYPTYSMVGRAVQKLRRFPLAGTFVSFPAEIVRTSMNIIKYLKQDLADPEMRPVALRRIAGLAIVSAGAYALQEALKDMSDVDDDEEEAIRNLAAPWNRSSNIAILGRDKDGKLRFIDLSFLDPYNYWKRPITAMLRDQPLDDKAVEAMRETLEPFLGQDIAFGAISEVWHNRKESGGRIYNPAEDPQKIALDIGNHLRRAVQPGVMANAENMWKAFSDEKSSSGRVRTIEDEVAANLGWRITTLDPKSSLYFQAYEFADKKRNASSILSAVARDPNEVSEDELKAAFNRALGARRQAFIDMHRVVKAAEKAGLNKFKIIQILRSNNVSKADSFALVSGKVPPWDIRKSYMSRSLKKADALFDAKTRKAFFERQRLLQKWARDPKSNREPSGS